MGWMDATHILVVLRASGGAAVRKAAELASQVFGVVAWMGFDEWRAAQAALADKSARSRTCEDGAKDEDGVSSPPPPPSEASGWNPASAGGLCCGSSTNSGA